MIPLGTHPPTLIEKFQLDVFLKSSLLLEREYYFIFINNSNFRALDRPTAHYFGIGQAEQVFQLIWNIWGVWHVQVWLFSSFVNNLRVGLTTIGSVHACSICCMNVSNNSVVWQWRVWHFYPFDLVTGWVDNYWFGTGLLPLLYECLKYFGVLAMTGLAFLYMWLKSCKQIVSRSSVLLYTSPLYNRQLPGANLASVLSMNTLQFLEVH